MSKQLSEHIKINLNFILQSVGDMALKRRARNIVEELEISNGDKILDIGCGNGYYLSLLNRLNLNVVLVGIDNDKVALRDAKIFISNDKVKLIYGNAQNLPFKNNSFDKLIMSEVIEHVEDEKKVLREAIRVIKKGGILTLTTCNIDYPFLWDPINWVLQHLFNTHIRKGFWAGIWNQHLRLYKKNEVSKLVKETGFRIDNEKILTGWCFPFNHYLINFVAIILSKLFYWGNVPKSFAGGMIKFQNTKQFLLVKIIFWLVNGYDRLNDMLPQRQGVSIFIKARK